MRCIKPNAQKSKDIFAMRMVVEQLRCAGVIPFPSRPPPTAPPAAPFALTSYSPRSPPLCIPAPPPSFQLRRSDRGDPDLAERLSESHADR